jgi:hypothetical protein
MATDCPYPSTPASPYPHQSPTFRPFSFLPLTVCSLTIRPNHPHPHIHSQIKFGRIVTKQTVRERNEQSLLTPTPTPTPTPASAPAHPHPHPHLLQHPHPSELVTMSVSNDLIN